MDFNAEMESMNDIPLRVAVTYKCLDLFRVCLKDSDEEKRGIYFGKCFFDGSPSTELLEAFKKFFKEQKSRLRKHDEVPVKYSDFAKVLWFLYHKIVENGIFTQTERKDIMSFMDLCQYVVL